MLLITVLPEPPTERVAEPVIVPRLLTASVPESELILLQEPAASVTRPPHVLLPEIFRKATVPKLFPNERASPATVIPPCSSTDPPFTTVPAAVPPKANAF